MGIRWTKPIFDRLYSGGYTREVVESGPFERRAEFLVERFALEGGGHVLVVGAGLGLLSDALEARGVDAISVDSSPYVRDVWRQAGRSGLVHSDIRRFKGGRFDLVVLEDLDGGYHDPKETREVADAAARFGPVVHFVTLAQGRPDSLLCWRSLDEWRNIVPSQFWFEA